MAAANPDRESIPSPSQHGPILARRSDGNRLTLYGDAVTELPDSEWFEVAAGADGKIVLTPIPDPKEAWRRYIAHLGLSEEQVRPPTEWELTPPAERSESPYAHLTLEQLRTLEQLTAEQWFEELRARGILQGKPKGVGVLNIKPVGRVPGALDRFLKERAEQD